MARYGDLDKLREEAFFADTDADVVAYVQKYGYADVVPRNEIAKIFEEIDRMCIDTFGNFNHRAYAELKKKHTRKGATS